jgi:hypothetical protein
VDPDHSNLSSKFREAALHDCEEDERVGIIVLADKVRNIFFVQGISLDRIPTIVRSRNGNAFDPINKNKLIYIRSAESILCVDKTRQYYYFSSDLELQKCKENI